MQMVQITDGQIAVLIIEKVSMNVPHPYRGPLLIFSTGFQGRRTLILSHTSSRR